MSKSVVVTGWLICRRQCTDSPGASGLLGRAVSTYFVEKGDKVLRLGFTRSADIKLDLTDSKAVDEFFANNKVDVVVHCAAERRPDVAEANPKAAERINVGASKHLSELALKYGFTLIYISTDYVFNGRNPPYEVDAKPDPLNQYGRQKLQGEQVTLETKDKGAKVIVLRVPVLYGKAEQNNESAVNVLVDVVQDQSGKKYTMDDYQIRNPTNVRDVARVCYELSHLPSDKLPPIAHIRSTGPPMTKWDMTKAIAKSLNLPIDHVTPVSTKPTSGTERPWNTELSVKCLEDLGVNVKEETPFGQWWDQYLGGK